MGSQVSIAYHLDVTGAVAAATLATKFGAVPVPPDLLNAFGLRVTSDLTLTVGSLITRTIAMSFLPSAPASATANLLPGDPSGSPVESVTVNGAGDGYVQPPFVSFPPPPPNDDEPPSTALAKAFLECKTPTVSAGGVNYAAPLITFVGGLPPADANKPPFAVNSLSLIKQGRNYTSKAVVQFQGSLNPGGHHAQATLTRDATTGAITSVTVIDPGSGYGTIPSAFIFDPGNTTGGVDPEFAAEVVVQPGSGTPATAHATLGVGGTISAIVMDTTGIGYVSIPAVVITDAVGTGAKATVSMGVGEIVVIYGGKGYLASAPPAVTLTPAFKSMFPDLASAAATLVSQASPFWDFMTAALVAGTLSPVRADAPVVT